MSTRGRGTFAFAERRGTQRGRVQTFKIGTRPRRITEEQQTESQENTKNLVQQRKGNNSWESLPIVVLQMILSFCQDEVQIRLVSKEWKKAFESVSTRIFEIPLLDDQKQDRIQSWNTRRGPSRSL